MYTAAREEVGAIRRETLAFLYVARSAGCINWIFRLRSEMKTVIEDMKSQEIPIRADMDELPSLLAHSEVSVFHSPFCPSK
jgi:hypothetical protein